ncbi:MAG: O-antigen ligase [Devosia sp.]
MSDLAPSAGTGLVIDRRMPSAIDVATFLFFVFATLAIWTQVQPFIDLQDPSALDDTTQSNTVRKIVTIALVLIGIALVGSRHRLRGLLSTIDLPLMLVVGWFGICSVLSTSPGLALNRLALAVSVIAIAACLPLLIRSLDACITALGVTVSIVVTACFLGVLLIPELSMHTLRDASEQTLAGDWRGVFSHKNELAAVSNIFVFTGVLIARTKNLIWGLVIVALSLTLMLMSGGKSALLLIVPVLAVSYLLLRNHSRWLGLTMVVALIGALVLLTIGSVAFPPVAILTDAIMPDPTFTGRTEIWQLAMDAIDTAPITGHGYSIFWDSGLAYQTAISGSPAALAGHAHNGYLETALSGGLPGLFLVLLWIGIMPWRNIETLKQRAGSALERAFLEFLAQTWLFGLLISCLEAVLFNRSNATWFSMVMATACLQQWVASRGVAK